MKYSNPDKVVWVSETPIVFEPVNTPEERLLRAIFGQPQLKLPNKDLKHA